MIEPTRIPNNPHVQLNQAEAKKQPVLDDLDVHPGINASDVYKQESYELRTPGILGGILFSKKLNAGEAMDRLSQGKKVRLKENVQLRATYDGMDSVSDRVVEEQTKKTMLNSSGDLESFARIESGAAPATEEEQVAQMLEKAEFKDLESKKNGSFYEVLDKKEKPISSFDAVNKLKNGEVVMLRERKIRGSHFTRTRNAKGSYGSWLVNPDKLGRNETLIKKRTSYGGYILKVQSEYKRLDSDVASDAIPFNSVEQIKNFLISDKNA